MLVSVSVLLWPSCSNSLASCLVSMLWANLAVTQFWLGHTLGNGHEPFGQFAAVLGGNVA